MSRNAYRVLIAERVRKYLGWKITYADGIWAAHRYGVRMRSRDEGQLKKMINQRIKDGSWV